MWEPVESRVLVVGVFRPRILPSAPVGEPTPDIATASEEIPYPTVVAVPLHPPDVLAGGVVLVEARIGEDGSVEEVAVIGHGFGLGWAAAEAVRQWQFRSASLDGQAAPSFVYVAVGFRRQDNLPGLEP